MLTQICFNIMWRPTRGQSVKRRYQHLWALYVNIIDPADKSHNAPVPYPTMHHSEQKCAHFCSECCIVGYVTGSSWDFVISPILGTRTYRIPWNLRTILFCSPLFCLFCFVYRISSQWKPLLISFRVVSQAPRQSRDCLNALLTRVKLNNSMNNDLHAQQNVGLNYISMHKLQRCSRICDMHSKAPVWEPGTPFYKHGLTLIPACTRNHMPSKMWHEITYPLVYFKGASVEIQKWVNTWK